jgi:hypothetical protein
MYNQDETRFFLKSLNKKQKNKGANKNFVEAVLKIEKEERLRNDEFWSVYASISDKKPALKYEKIWKLEKYSEVSKYCAPQ